jgi:hypothetical protein
MMGTQYGIIHTVLASRSLYFFEGRSLRSRVAKMMRSRARSTVAPMLKGSERISFHRLEINAESWASEVTLDRGA